METHRIKMKIGDAEFEAEGPKEVVTAQFEAFMSAVSAMQRAAPVAPVLPAAQIIPATLPPDGGAQILSDKLLDRVFRQGDTLSLAALPTGDNAMVDAMLLLLYGYLKLKNETSVTGTTLMKSAKVSGVNFDRVDRVMRAAQPDFVLVAGAKKGRRYQLNNRGMAKAEEIIKDLVQ